VGWLSAIFGSNENTGKLVDSAVAGLDKIVFTDEERAEGMAKMREWYLRYLEATQPQNRARRFIAMLIVGLFVFLVVLATGVWMWRPDYSAFIFEVLTDTVATPFAIIIGFYYAAHVARQLPGKK